MNQSAYIDRTYRKYDNILDLYAAKIFRTVGSADEVLAMETMDHLRRPPEESAMAPIVPGTAWGREYGNIWLRTRYTVPAEADGLCLCAIPDASAVEILCFKDGKPTGIINSKNRFIGGEHSAMFVDAEAKAGDSIDLAFECYAGHTCFGTSPYASYGRDESAIDHFERRYNGIRFCVMDTVFRDFVFDLSTVLQLARLPGENFVSLKAHECLMDAFPYLIQDTACYSDDELRESAARVSELLSPALEKVGGEASRGRIGTMGHSHMDTAWLWPVSETVRKCARTYAQALTLMDMYPDYTFIQSSALHLDWMKQYYPDIFEGIKQKVAEGRYEPNGGVWVECDCNITGGEAMVRQFLYGQRYTQKEVGFRSDSFWLPDTFGYNGAIPQIMQGCGVKYFYTTKMSWNDCNVFPADTFRWRGIDGTEVITHLNRMHLMPDVSTFTGAVREIRDKRSNDQRLVAYGYGDGGGGPTYGMLEFLKRVKDLPGMPEIKPTTASAFMHGLEAKKDRLPLHDGELYLEYHRGTLTQMHMVKETNRRAERLLYDMELMNVLSGEPTNARHDELYKVLLKNQFHDILPGTCIPKVYEVYREEMDAMTSETLAEARNYAGSFVEPTDGALSFFNPLPFAVNTICRGEGEIGVSGRAVQTYTDADGVQKTVFRAELPALAAEVVNVGEAEESSSRFEADGNALKTPYYLVKFDENGYIVSLIDRQNDRELANLSGAPLGTLWFGEDMPTNYDNWEIEDDVFKKMRPVTKPVSREVVSDGAVEYRIRTVYKFGKNSTAWVDTVFYAGSRQIDYEMKLDWQERHSLLKAGFDVNIRSAFVKNEIQFGHVDRPTTRNTSLEAAKFEVCNHKWSDLSETNYGVALLNNCKYGMSCEGSDMRLTLHKGGCRPDPFTDIGVCYMKYALLPHMGPFTAESVVLPAYAFNHEPFVFSGSMKVPALFSVDKANIIAEAVKNAEDVENAYVLRLYECERSTTNATLKLSGAKKVWLTNMLEETIEELPSENGEVKLTFRPFEIKTILVER